MSTNTETYLDSFLSYLYGSKSYVEEEPVPDISVDNNNCKYVITLNDNPIGHVSDLKSAEKQIQDIAEMMSFEYSSDWNTNIVKFSDTETRIIGSYRFNIISYDTVLCYLKYYPVSEILPK